MKKVSFIRYVRLVGVTLLVPATAFALSDTFKDIVGYMLSILNLVWPILNVAAFLFFFWGLSKFVINAGNANELDKGKKYMMWGVLALFVLFTYKAFVSFIAADLEIGDGKTIPYLPESSAQQ